MVLLVQSFYVQTSDIRAKVKEFLFKGAKSSFQIIFFATVANMWRRSRPGLD